MNFKGPEGKPGGLGVLHRSHRLPLPTTFYRLTHTHMHAHMQTHTYTHTHKYMQGHTFLYVHMQTNKPMHTCRHTHTDAQRHAHMQICTYAESYTHAVGLMSSFRQIKKVIIREQTSLHDVTRLLLADLVSQTW